MTFQPLRTYAYDDLAIGTRDVLMRTVMETDLVDFAEVSGDVNPIHLSEDYAASTRFGGRIAHGMFTASLISAVIGSRMPGPGAVYLSQTLNFLAPVKIGDVVCASVEVVEKLDKGRRVRLACTCVADGRAVLEGDAWVSVPAGSGRAGTA